jgi:hypothetical protein
VTVLVLLDLSAAFDCVDHGLMTIMLQKCGIEGNALDWLKSYLTGRSQSVLVRQARSDSLPVEHGVPQGSVLGPILFNIYLSGLGQVISGHGVEHIIYADDIQLFVSSSPPDVPSAILKLETCIRDVKQHLASLWLTLNENKTEFIFLGPSRLTKKITSNGLKVGDSLVSPSDVVRDLGVMIDSSMTMSDHVKRIRKAAFARLKLIARIRRSIPLQHTTLLVKSLVISHLTFCMPLLAGITAKSLASLQQIIHAAVRLIHGLRKRDSIESLVKKEGWMPVSSMIEVRVLSLTFGVLKSGKPSFLRSLLANYAPTRELRSQNKSQLVVPRSSNCLGDRSFRYVAPTLWNKIPVRIKDHTSRASFLKECIEHVVQRLAD